MTTTMLRSVRRFTRTGVLALMAGAFDPTLGLGFAAAQGSVSGPGPGPGPGPSVQGTYRVAKRIAIGGDGGWDYLAVDAAARRLYVSHATHVVVVDLTADTVLGDIPNTPGVHGIALAPALGRGFTSNGRDSTVTIFDLKTLEVIARVNVGGRNPDAIVYDPATKRVFTMNGGSADLSALDAATGKVLGQLPLGGRPEFVVSDGRGRLYINIEDRSELAEVDPAALQVLRRWSIRPCEGPSGLALDPARRRLFSVCDKVMAVSDIAAGKLLTTVAIGDGPDGAAFDPALHLAFSSNGEGTLSVVREDGKGGYAVAQTLMTKRGARTVTLDPSTHRLYTASADFGPPPASTPEQPRPRPSLVPNSFQVLVLEPTR